jgi:hypothetical protein
MSNELKTGLRYFAELVRSFRITLIVFASVSSWVWLEHDAVAAWFLRVAGTARVTSVSSAPSGLWMAVALRLGVLAAAVPLASEGWLYACRRLGKPERARWWPLLCVVTAVALAGCVELALHASGQSLDYLIYFHDAPGVAYSSE